jgi:hypothetical protein
VTLRRTFSFPNPVNEVSARLVAAGVVAMAVTYLLTGSVWVLAVVAYGFVARVLAGSRFSPLGLLVTRVVTPRLRVEARLVPGPPKRFAQGIGVTFSLTALALATVVGAPGAAKVVVALLAGAALLESAFAFCLGCKVFALLMRVGVVPATVCEDCGDLTRRLAPAPTDALTR